MSFERYKQVLLFVPRAGGSSPQVGGASDPVLLRGHRGIWANQKSQFQLDFDP